MNTKTTPKDFFLHLGAAIALYSGAAALISLAFAIVDYLLPDKLAGAFYSPSMAWPMAMLVIVVPVLYLLEWLIGRDIRAAHEKKELWIRRWRLFLTLFLAAILLAGDLIALLNTYFNGEITSRFVWKALIILVVAAAVGLHYFYALYDRASVARLFRRITLWAGAALVVAGVVGGFLITGSPARQRDLRFDSQRVSDLQNIQWQVVSFWQQHSKLPQDLAALNDGLSGFAIPTDPETDGPYEYASVPSTTSSSVSFKLCATFSLPTPDTKGRGAYGGRGGVYPTYDSSYPVPVDMGANWDHAAGHVCFTRSIDPARYPPTPSSKQGAIEPQAI